MNLVLWVVQKLLAVAFFAHGWLFLTPPAALVEQMNASLPRGFQLFVGGRKSSRRWGLRFPASPGSCPGWLAGRPAGS
jgi:hypothetical protein